MNGNQMFRAIIRGGAAGIVLLLSLLAVVSIFPSIDESIVGRMVWDMPVPMTLIEKISSVLFESRTDDRGLVVVFAAIGIEYAIIGALVGLVFHAVRRNAS